MGEFGGVIGIDGPVLSLRGDTLVEHAQAVLMVDPDRIWGVVLVRSEDWENLTALGLVVMRLPMNPPMTGKVVPVTLRLRGWAGYTFLVEAPRP